MASQPITVSSQVTLSVPADTRLIDHDTRIALMACFLSGLKGANDDQRETAQLLVTLTALALPEIVPELLKMTSVKVDPTPWSQDQWERHTGLVEGEDFPTKRLFIPFPSDPIPQASSVSKVEAAYASYSLVLFSIGRQARQESKTAMMDNRPKALIGQFRLNDDDKRLLPGEIWGPDLEFLGSVYDALSQYAEVRFLIIHSLLRMKASTRFPPPHLAVIMTNLTLMKWSGLTHVGAIIALKDSHPWSVKMPELESYWKAFCADLRKLEAIPADERPYHRLLAPQQDFLFLSADLLPLIAVAGAFKEEVEKTFGGYVYRKDAYKDLIAKAKAYAAASTQGAALPGILSFLGIADVPLPTLPQPGTSTNNQVV